ncbi:hypothetical protein BC827DRAFT_1155369 [Russula dissimulans]|nr:hypothetical protein BC827DRAFT_1155369 [Russula dissimulans]
MTRWDRRRFIKEAWHLARTGVSACVSVIQVGVDVGPDLGEQSEEIGLPNAASWLLGTPSIQSRTARRDTFSLSMGILMGTSAVMAVIEGAIGISGDRITRLSLQWLASRRSRHFHLGLLLFFASINIPPRATGGALVILGTSMMPNVREIDWC